MFTDPMCHSPSEAFQTRCQIAQKPSKVSFEVANGQRVQEETPIERMGLLNGRGKEGLRVRLLIPLILQPLAGSPTHRK